MKLPFNLMKKPYIRKQKTKVDRVMAGIAMFKHFNDEYPSEQEILDAFEHQKLEYNDRARESLLKEFPGIILPEIEDETKEDEINKEEIEQLEEELNQDKSSEK